MTLPALPLPCLCCGRELESAFPTDPPLWPDERPKNQPYAGTAFTTHGHYGSTVFDSMTGSFLEVNICDDCLRAKAKFGRILYGVTVSRPETTYAQWDPNATDH